MIGDNIKKMRESKKLDAKSIAAKAEITPAYLSLIENNKRENPNIKILHKIADALKVPLSSLYDTDKEGLLTICEATDEYNYSETIAANRKDGYEGPLTDDEIDAVNVFLETYRKMKKDKED